MAAAKLDEYWSHLRMTDPDLIGFSLLKPGYGSFARNTQLDVSTATEQCITLPEALETYVTQRVLVSRRALKPPPRELVIIL